MSVEAISWALNLAPVPRDSSGKRNPACKAVLLGLANHANPDGKDAYPGVRRLARYTELSERTVRTALDRLQAGIIRPGDPAVVAAKINRADQRPQGWDLAMHLVRDDLDDELAAPESQFPGLSARVTAARPAADDQAGNVGAGPESGGQPLHPAPEGPVDNPPGGARPLHLAAGTGCNHRRNGVQSFPQRGAAVAPKPSVEPSPEPPALRAGARQPPAPVDNCGQAAADQTGEFFAALGPRWRLTTRQRERLAPAVASVIAAGWNPCALAAFAGGNPEGVRTPYAVLAARLSPGELPAPPDLPPPRPPWCGNCDNERTRYITGPDGRPARCPACHPLRPADRPA